MTDKTMHTKGPWHWVDSLTDAPWDGKSYLASASLRTVAEFGSNETKVVDGKRYTEFRLPKFILDAEGIGGDEADIANAQLIASAPAAADALDAQAERIKALEGALIPDGWKLVPREATIGMCEAAYGGAFDTVKQLDWFKAQWRDYLEAVPEVSNARALLGEK